MALVATTCSVCGQSGFWAGFPRRPVRGAAFRERRAVERRQGAALRAAASCCSQGTRPGARCRPEQPALVRVQGGHGADPRAQLWRKVSGLAALADQLAAARGAADPYGVDKRRRAALRPRPARLRAPRGPRAPQPGKTRRVCSRPAATRTPAMCANPRRRRLQGATGRQLGPRPARPTRAAAGAQRCLGAAHAPHRRGPTPLLARAAVPALAGRRLTPRAEPAPEARRRSPHPGRGGARRRRLRRGGRAARRRPCWGGAARAGAQARRACLACGRPRGAVIRRGPLWRVGAGGLRARQRSAAGGRGPGLVSA